MTVLSSSRQGSGRSGQIPNLRIRWDGDAGSEITPRDGGMGWKARVEERRRGVGGMICTPVPPHCAPNFPAFLEAVGHAVTLSF